MSLDTAITNVAGILGTVANIGKVHTYVRRISDEKTFADQFKDAASGQVRAWTVTREATDSRDKAVQSVRDLHTLVIRGYMSVQDANNSERTFQLLVELVRSSFRANRKLTFNAVSLFWSTPMRARLVTQAEIGEYLVHYCELVLDVEEYPV